MTIGVPTRFPSKWPLDGRRSTHLQGSVHSFTWNHTSRCYNDGHSVDYSIFMMMMMMMMMIVFFTCFVVSTDACLFADGSRYTAAPCVSAATGRRISAVVHLSSMCRKLGLEDAAPHVAARWRCRPSSSSEHRFEIALKHHFFSGCDSIGS